MTVKAMMKSDSQFRMELSPGTIKVTMEITGIPLECITKLAKSSDQLADKLLHDVMTAAGAEVVSSVDNGGSSTLTTHTLQ